MDKYIEELRSGMDPETLRALGEAAMVPEPSALGEARKMSYFQGDVPYHLGMQVVETGILARMRDMPD